MYKYLFGPVPSRRLGMSLGIDLVPKKVCTLDCVYCESGKTTKLTVDRKEYISFKKITNEIAHYFDNNPIPDYITFSGAGEPLLNSRLSDIVDFIKSKNYDIPLALITNGNLFYDETIRKSLQRIDLVLPSLDAVSQDVFERINRPHKAIDVQMCLQSLKDFAKEYKGRIWLEILILPGYNDSKSELDKLLQTAKEIDPEIVQLNTLDRPGTEKELGGASYQQLQKIKDEWAWDKVQIVKRKPPKPNPTAYRKDLKSTILGTISRRPSSAYDLVEILGLELKEIHQTIDDLLANNKIYPTKQGVNIFYHAK